MRLSLSTYYGNTCGFYFFFILPLCYYIAFLGKKIMCVGCIRLSHEFPITNCFYEHGNFNLRRDSIMTSCYLHIPSPDDKVAGSDGGERAQGWRSEDSYPPPGGCVPLGSSLPLSVPPFLYLYNGSWLSQNQKKQMRKLMRKLCIKMNHDLGTW